ncbi:MAG TPA: UDP-N-acetylmuramate dehydrogenase [Myxococcota bacterium]|nr:UDP-N-acetylmuramate dehydrogenase [Myxococcota bacterium]HRY95528.1 UDP-N-acetylmuramate dehydrogenase [Myxococcota bacterium]HSA19930.1 UDP-N-acetylmuramate dehydrogenase [Myxococcota bacterium]
MQVLENHSLKALHTLGCEARARLFAEARTLDELRAGLALGRERGLPVVLLGGGSNVLFRADLEALVLKVALDGLEPAGEEGGQALVRAAAGVGWDALVEDCLRRGLHGLENLSGIPGTAGAAPVQNIGAYGVELAERLHSLEALDRHSGELRRLTARECHFGYRDSIFKRALRDRLVICAVTLRLSRAPAPRLEYAALRDELQARGLARPTPAQVRDAVLAVRARKLPDPAVLGNAGSFFQNPIVAPAAFAALRAVAPDAPGYPEPDGRVKLAAGWLIERCGFKGARRGDAGVHSGQALVLVNHGQARGQELLALADEIRAGVAARYGVRLELEPRVY